MFVLPRDSRSSFHRSLRIWISTLLGALALSILSLAQKQILGASLFALKGFLVPVLFGGISGFIIGLYVFRKQNDFRLRLQEQEEAHIVLAESEERFRLLAENARDVVFRWQLEEHQYQYVSPAVFTLTGHTPQEFLDNPGLLQKLILPDDLQVFQELTQQIQKGSVSPSIEYRLIHRNGNIVWVNQRHAFSFNDEGVAVSLEGICTDITQYRVARQEKQELENRLQQSQKMEAIGRLAGGIAHDFNNLLTVINGYSELLLEETSAEGQESFELQEIQKAGLKAADLTAQLLTFSRKQITKPRLVNPSVAMGESLRMLHRMLGEDIKLVTDIPDDLPNIFIDSIQLDQVLLNLVINAREAMPHGGTLAVSLHSENVEHYQCSLCQNTLSGPLMFLVISDTGCGMEKAVRERIFDPFFTTKESTQSTGLGLATVYGIVHQNEGHIDVESTVNEGSSFTIIFPCASEAPQTEPALPEVHSHQLRGSETILVVEDEPLVRSLTATVLQQYGYQVLIAENATEAMDIFQVHKNSIDLLLTDVVMPGISGVEFSKEVEMQKPDIKIIFMSGYVDNKLNVTGIAESSHPFLKKPFGSEALVRLVRQALDNSPS